MLYYRTHASRAGELPPELLGWTSASAETTLSENTVGDMRVVAITAPFVFAPPEAGWVKLCAGWEVASVGEFNPLAHANIHSTFQCVPTPIDGKTWLLPVVLNKAGTRGFKVAYGGEDFTPQLTPVQQSALALVQEIRTCHDAGTMPDRNTQALWASRLLPLTYALSSRSIGVLNILTDDLVDATLAIAGGYHGNTGG